MHRRLFCALMALVLFVMVPANAELGQGTGPASGAVSASDTVSASDFVRLHVVAEGDSAWEQDVKLHVRDACLALARAELSESADADRAYAALNANLARFQTTATLAAREMGFAGDVAVETGVFDFPDRIYGNVLVPAGAYRALRVTLGTGEGHNWWCVLYPTLCVIDEAAGLDGDPPPIEFYSSIGNFLSGLFGG